MSAVSPARVGHAVPPGPASLATSVSRTVVVVAIAGSWALPPWVVFVSGLLAGLPHGAVDHLVPRWWLGARAPRMPVVLITYAATVAGSYLAFQAWPLAAVIGFVIISGWHFGSGETGFSDLRAGRAVPHRVLRGLAHVTTALALPTLLHADAVLPLLSAVVQRPVELGPDARRALGAVAVLAVGLVVAGVANELVAGRRAEAIDLTLLLALAVLVSPLAAFGVYFGAWHSVRHLARTLVDAPANGDDLARGRLLPPLARFAREAVGPALVSLVVILALWHAADGWRGFAAGYLALLAGLTVPHLIVVGWADRRRALAL